MYVLAWRIPGTGEPGGLPSMGSHRVGHDWSDLAAAAAAEPAGCLVRSTYLSASYFFFFKEKHPFSDCILDNDVPSLNTFPVCKWE